MEIFDKFIADLEKKKNAPETSKFEAKLIELKIEKIKQNKEMTAKSKAFFEKLKNKELNK